jgi:hypothetical protein
VPRWWPLAVIVALVVGLVAGAAGWQATRSNATAVTRQLAERYLAANPYMHPSRVPQLFAPNAVWIDATMGDIYRGRAGVQRAYADSMLPNIKVKDTLVYAGPDMFIVDERMTASSTAVCATNQVRAVGVYVNQVKNGLITRQTVWWDTSSVLHCSSTYLTSPTMPR